MVWLWVLRAEKYNSKTINIYTYIYKNFWKDFLKTFNSDQVFCQYLDTCSVFFIANSLWNFIHTN